jgi:CheY-like chemotaxis protein
MLGNQAELREVIINMLLNSVDALPRGGVISFSTWHEDGEIFLRIKDNGVGMSAETRKMAFEPFFSAKSEKGYGLGMAVAQSIVLQHQGDLLLESEESKGTTVTIRLPVSTLKDRKDTTRTELPVGKLSVLVIEDEKELQRVLAEILFSRGWKIEVANSATEAISFLKSEKYDLIIADSAISGITIWDFADEVKELNLKTPIILVAGWGYQILTKDAIDLGVEAVLSRPISTQYLRQTIARSLQSQQTRAKVKV